MTDSYNLKEIFIMDNLINEKNLILLKHIVDLAYNFFF